MPNRYALFLLAVLPLAAAAAESDHERARRVREAGDVLPLAQIVAAAESSFAGSLTEVELERDDGRWVYELEMLTPQGHVIELTYDARTGALLETEGRGVAAARKTPQ